MQNLNAYVELEHLPEQFGGTFDFRHGMLPKPDQEVQTILNACLNKPNGQLSGPFKWICDSTEVSRIVPVGSVEGVLR